MTIVVHYSEIGIKGDNRVRFEQRLAENIRLTLGRRATRVHREYGRLVVEHEALEPAAALARLGDVPGIAHFAEVSSTPLDLDAITAEAVRLTAGLRSGTFRITTRRSDKRYPMSSVAVNRAVGAAVNSATGLAVELETPDHTVWIEITAAAALLYRRRIRGLGGLPVGISGRVVALLSGGIDSPVAAFRLIRRGCRAILVHFHNYTRYSEQVRDKILELARVLTRYQLRTRLYLVPFEDAQAAIISAVAAPERMVAYRRAMLRVGERVLVQEGAHAFVTGDAVGQVASQTLENIRAIHGATRHPILSPLIGDDKEDIVAAARRIGTYEVSIRPYDDCCSFLVARHPNTKVDLASIESRESVINMDDLATRALAAAEVHNFESAGLAAAAPAAVTQEVANEEDR